MRSEYDVVVVGGGTAGTIAGIQSARMGVRTLVVEKNGILGGTLVTGAIPYPASFHSYGRQVIAGIGWDLCCRARLENGDPIPDPSKRPTDTGGRFHFPVNPALFAALADEMLIDAGSDLLFHAMPASVESRDDRWRLTVCTKTGLRELGSKIIVDCTGDANVVGMAGFRLKRNPELQAATLVVHVGGYDAEALDYDLLQRAFEDGVNDGEVKRTDPGWGRGRLDFFLKSYGGNRIHVTDVDACSSEGKTNAEVEGRKAMMRLLRFCRRQPGLENMRVTYCATECGIRETVTIDGRKSISVQDYESGRMWEDAVCYTSYHVDIHRADHIVHRILQQGIYPTIPLGALLPAGSRNIIVAGRCAAGDWEANSAYRVEASCMAMGQAAGAVSALAVRQGVDIESVPMADLYSALHEHGAIVPGDVDA